MASLDSLPADQRAVLQLLLKQGKSYDDLSTLLRVDAESVRDRARDAVDALGPDDPAVDMDRRDEIADYLLGQQTASQRAATREYLEGSASGRSYARATAKVLEPLSADGLPEIPAERAEVDEAFDALHKRTERRKEVQKSSRTGGILVLAGLGIALAVGLILLIGGGGDDDDDGDSASTTGGPPPQVLAQAQLEPPEGREDDALGIAFVVRQGNQTGLAVQARGLEASSENAAYAVWLYNSPSNARFLGFVQTPVGEDGNLQSVSALTQSIEGFRNILLTRESEEEPSRPGEIIIRGRLQEPPPPGQQGTTPGQTAPAPGGGQAPQGQAPQGGTQGQQAPQGQATTPGGAAP